MHPPLSDPFISNRRQSQFRIPVNWDRARPPAFAVQQPRHGQGTMNESESLRVRVIELETELRFTKDQLLQSQSGTQYLVNCFANQQNRNVVQEVGQKVLALEDRNDQLQTEVRGLRHQLCVQATEKFGVTTSPLNGGWAGEKSAMPPWNRGWEGEEGSDGNQRVQTLEDEVAVLREQRASLLNDVLTLLKEDPYEYSFNFDDGDAAAFRPLEHFPDKVSSLTRQETSLLDDDLLGQSEKELGSPFRHEAAVETDRVDSPQVSPVASVKSPNVFVKPGDLGILDPDPAELIKYQRHAAQEAAMAQQARDAAIRVGGHHPFPRQGFRQDFRAQTLPSSEYNDRERRQHTGIHHFALFEHQHLIGMATFIEDMDHDQYLECFQSLENDVRMFSGRHSKEEWRTYYEKHVRPAYLQKMAKRGQQAAENAVHTEVAVEEAGPVNAEFEDVQDEESQMDLFKAPKDAPTLQAVQGAAAQNDGEALGRQVEVDVEPLAEGDHAAGVSDSSDIVNPKAASPEAYPCALPDETNTENELAKTFDGRRSSRSRPIYRAEEDLPMPQIPAFGPVNLLSKPGQTSTGEHKGGLTSGWQRSQPHPRFHSPPSNFTCSGEKDPRVWRYLFCDIDQQSARGFVFGQNEKLFRAVLITGVPVGTRLVDVLDRVRGGKIVGAKFSDTAGMRTEPPITANSVLVEFLCSRQAKGFVDCCETRPILCGVDREGLPAKLRVELIPTQTWRLPQRMIADMLAPVQALTRVLFLIFTNREQAPSPEELARDVIAFAVRKFFSESPRYPLRITADDEGMMLFEYAHVRHAAAAWHAIAEMEQKGFLDEVSKGFAADPCERKGNQREVDINKEGGEVRAAGEVAENEALADKAFEEGGIEIETNTR